MIKHNLLIGRNKTECLVRTRAERIKLFASGKVSITRPNNQAPRGKLLSTTRIMSLID